MDTQADLDFLKQLEDTDPNFVLEYTGGTKSDMIAKVQEKVLSIRQCAEDMGVCENTILNHIRSGKIKANFTDGRWRINEGDFFSYKASAKVLRGKGRAIIHFNGRSKKREDINGLIKEEQMISRIVYNKATSRTITDFLHTWHRNRSPGFSLPTICRDFNQVSGMPASEIQMSGILSSLKEKGIVIRKGKGIYQVSPSIVGETMPTEQQEQPIQPVVLVDEPVRESSSRVYSKKIERLAIESFIADNFDQHKDLSFTVNELSRKFPHLNRTKLGKACINMHTAGKFDRGTGVGEYIKRATKAKQAEIVPAAVHAHTQSHGMEGVKKIMESNLDERLKLELIKKFLD